MMCGKCGGIFAWLLLILGIVFLLVDLNVWSFWGIQWWTALLILFGAVHLGMSSCADCKKSKRK